jgi:hypothetical protein
MAPTTITLDENAGKMVAMVSTLVVGNLMAVLLNKGLLDRSDIAEVVAFTRAASADDPNNPNTSAMVDLCASALEVWVRNVVKDN